MALVATIRVRQNEISLAESQPLTVAWGKRSAAPGKTIARLALAESQPYLFGES